MAKLFSYMTMAEKNTTLKILVQAFSDRNSLLEMSAVDFFANLKKRGFSEENISNATAWIMQLMQQLLATTNNPTGTRIFMAEECAKLDVTCRDFIMYLERIQILEAKTREILINQLLLLNQDTISINDIKIVTLAVLMLQPSSQEDKIQKLQRFSSVLNEKKY